MAPEGAVAKISGLKVTRFTGPARVYDSEEAATEALLNDEVKPGDVVVIPAGTGHLFTKIDDHVNYLMVRIDPDKVTPLRSEAQSKAYLSKPARQ